MCSPPQHHTTGHGLEFWLVYYCSPVEPVIIDQEPVVDLPTLANRLARIWQVVWTGSMLSFLLSYGRAADHFGKDATATPNGALYVGVTWSLAINHAMYVVVVGVVCNVGVYIVIVHSQ